MTLNDKLKSEEKSSANSSRKRDNIPGINIQEEYIRIKAQSFPENFPIRAWQFDEKYYIIVNGSFVLEAENRNELREYMGV